MGTAFVRMLYVFSTGYALITFYTSSWYRSYQGWAFVYCGYRYCLPLESFASSAHTSRLKRGRFTSGIVTPLKRFSIRSMQLYKPLVSSAHFYFLIDVPFL